MTLRAIRRLAVTAIAVGSLATVAAPAAAHADTLPGNTPSSPVPAFFYTNGCSTPPFNAVLDTVPFVDPSPWNWGRTFWVSFRPACDMHDAGYLGGIVFDPVNGGVVNTTTMDRATIDNRFLGDLITLCGRSIPWYAPAALATCVGVASTYYGVVRTFGWALFDASPAVPGQQFVGTRPNN
jgi:hypothetical protein